MSINEKRNPTRRIATVVGLLFITATAASILGSKVILDPIFNAPDYLSAIFENEKLWITGVLVDSINSAAVVAIAIMLFPVLRKQNEALSLGYIASRIIESAILIVGSISLLSLTTLSGEHVQAGAPDDSYFQVSGAMVLSVYEWTWLLGPMIVFSITALILNYLLYRSALVPRWISIWGFLGGILLLSAGLLGMYGLSITSPISLLLTFPIFLNEMVLAIWLIAKGFNQPAIDSDS